MTPSTQPTGTTSNLPISSPTSHTHLSQSMTSTVPSPSPSHSQRNTGAIIGGTIVGAFAGIILLVVFANTTFLFYRLWKRNSDPKSRRGPPPAAPIERPPENALPGLVEMTTRGSVPRDGMPTYQRMSSHGTPLNNAQDASAASQPLMQEVITPDPPMRRTTVRLSRSPTLSQIDMANGSLPNAPPNLYLIPSDPFASMRQPLPTRSSQDQQEPHILQRAQSILEHTLRQSQSGSIPRLTQTTISEQEMEFIAQEVMTFILTDSALVESPSTYSSPPTGLRSPTSEHSRRSQILSCMQRSPTLGVLLPLQRQLSRGSSMEGG